MAEDSSSKKEIVIAFPWWVVPLVLGLAGVGYWLVRRRSNAGNVEPLHLDLSFVRHPAAPMPNAGPAAEGIAEIELPPAPVVETAVAGEPPAAPAAVAAGEDDLTVLNGIGPRIAAVLREAGITSFQGLAEITPERISEILRAAGLRLANTKSWPEQARLAAAGKWDELKSLAAAVRPGHKND